MTLLLVQISLVLLAALFCGSIACRLGQARVIGEIVGGLLLGPSVLGRIAPHTFATLFPKSSLGSLEILSNIGLILFLFVIGSELDGQQLWRQRSTAALTSAASIVMPFALAILIAPALYSRFAPADVRFLPFTLFLGISLSITAFPVLARILEERGMQTTPLGSTALLCAAVNDLCAWLLLAVALTLIPAATGNVSSLLHRFLWLAAYLAVMALVVRPGGKWIARARAASPLSHGLFAGMIVIVLASAAATDAIGIHPLFGAFLAGLCFPRVETWQTNVRARLETIVSILLLPLFFALTGLRTRLDLLTGRNIWAWTGLILLLAVAGKVGGAVLAAKTTGQTWQNAFALGALLNTRGLVELIVLNIAYDAHVFTPALFTMLLVMALLTTMATAPLLNWIGIEDRHNPRKP